MIDSAPLLGLADAQVLAQEVDDLLLVARTDRLTMDDLSDLRDVLARVRRSPIGIVAIGGQAQASPYYLPVSEVVESGRS